MSAIKKIELFQCPKCDESYDSRVKAFSCMEKCFVKEAKDKASNRVWDKKRNKLRLEAASVSEVLDLIVKYAYEFFGAKLKITDSNLQFGMVSCSHNAPIGKKTNWGGQHADLPREYLGWSGNLTGKWITNGKDRWGEKMDGFTRLTEGGGLAGIHTGCFNGGRGHFDGEFRFFLDDFPKLKEKYTQYKKLQAKEKAMQEQEALQTKKVDALVETMVTQDDVIADLEAEWVELDERKDEVAAELQTRKGGYKESAEKDKHITYPIAKRFSYDKKKLEEIGRTFRGRNDY